MRFKHATLMIFLASVVSITTACGGGYNSSSGGAGARPLTDLAVYAQSAPSIPVGDRVTLVAQATYGDPKLANPYKDVTSSATWSASDPSVATVAGGTVIGVGTGSVTISAVFGGLKDSTTVVVGLAPNIVITPSDAGAFSLSQSSRQFVATATYSDGTVFDLTAFTIWDATPKGTMKFDDPYGLEPGLATFLSPGTATISATLRAGESGSLTVTVGP